MIIGTDEETGFRCVDHYFKQEEMPTIGFAPDADFPLINAEKALQSLCSLKIKWVMQRKNNYYYLMQESAQIWYLILQKQ